MGCRCSYCKYFQHNGSTTVNDDLPGQDLQFTNIGCRIGVMPDFEYGTKIEESRDFVQIKGRGTFFHTGSEVVKECVDFDMFRDLEDLEEKMLLVLRAMKSARIQDRDLLLHLPRKFSALVALSEKGHTIEDDLMRGAVDRFIKACPEPLYTLIGGLGIDHEFYDLYQSEVDVFMANIAPEKGYAMAPAGNSALTLFVEAGGCKFGRDRNDRPFYDLIREGAKTVRYISGGVNPPEKEEVVEDTPNVGVMCQAVKELIVECSYIKGFANLSDRALFVSDIL